MDWREWDRCRQSACSEAIRRMNFHPAANVAPVFALYDELCAAKRKMVVSADELVECYRPSGGEN